MPRVIDPIWEAHPGPQADFLARGEWEVMYGGSAGGGKSDALLMDAARDVWHPRYKALLARRTFQQLKEIIDRSRIFYAAMGGEYKASEHRWYWPGGGVVEFGHVQNESDVYNYQGQDYAYIGLDEAGQFTPFQYLYLFSRCRSAVPGLTPTFRATANPGGPNHAFLKKRFRIGLVEPGTTIFEEQTDTETGEIYRTSRVFIPARVYDNPTLMTNDPQYLQRLLQLPEVEKRRLLYGSWDIFSGQAFPELNADVHMFDQDIPAEWEVFGAFDWGSSKPWSYGLWAIDFDGGLYRFAEVYGAKKDESGEYLDEGLRQTDPEIARDIIALEAAFRVKPRYRVACKATHATKILKGGVKGPAPEETMRREGLSFQPGDQDRVPGRRQIHLRLKLDDDGRPGLQVHKRCEAWWQTLPLMVEDDKNPEDILEKNQPDHCFEETRMALMSRPIRPKTSVLKAPAGSFQAERRKMIERRKREARLGRAA